MTRNVQRHALLCLVAPLLLAMTLACSVKTTVGASYTGRGVVVQVNAETGKIKINHEKIEGFMDAMTMWFVVKDKAILNGISPQDRVEFTVVETGEDYAITEIRKV